MYSWIMLILAIVAEVVSTISMKYASAHSPMLGYLIMIVMISFSIFALSRALLGISLAVAYALWEGVGLFFIAIAGVYLFGEQLNALQLIAIALMMLGLLLVTLDKGGETA